MSRRIKTVKEFIAKKNEVTVFWKSTGLLEGLSSEDENILAEKLEEIAQILLTMMIHVYPETENVAFPIVRLTFGRYKHLINDAMAVLKLIDSKIPFLVEDLNSYSSSSAESEFCDIMAQEIAHRKL